MHTINDYYCYQLFCLNTDDVEKSVQYFIDEHKIYLEGGKCKLYGYKYEKAFLFKPYKVEWSCHATAWLKYKPFKAKYDEDGNLMQNYFIQENSCF